MSFCRVSASTEVTTCRLPRPVFCRVWVISSSDGTLVGRLASGPKPHRLTRGPTVTSSAPLALAANVNGLGHHPGCVTGDHQRGRLPLCWLKRDNSESGTVGGHLIVDPLQQDIHLGLQAWPASVTAAVRHLDGVVGAHGAAGDVDLRLGLDRSPDRTQSRKRLALRLARSLQHCAWINHQSHPGGCSRLQRRGFSAC